MTARTATAMNTPPLPEWDSSSWRDQRILRAVFAADTAIGWAGSAAPENDADFLQAFDRADLEGLRGNPGVGPGMFYVLAGTPARNPAKGVMILVRSGEALWEYDAVLAAKELPHPPEISREELSPEAQKALEDVLKEISPFLYIVRSWIAGLGSGSWMPGRKRQTSDPSRDSTAAPAPTDPHS